MYSNNYMRPLFMWLSFLILLGRASMYGKTEGKNYGKENVNGRE